MIIVSSVKKEMEVGIMIALQRSSMADMAAENLYNLGNEENIEVGSTIVKPNGNDN